MLGWHVLIGLGEALITALVVGSVVAARPDLVHGARPLLAARPLEIRTSPTAERSRHMRTRTFLLVGLLVALLLAGVGQLLRQSATPTASSTSPSRPASSTPPTTTRAADGPMADYAVEGVDNPRLAGGLAGVIGILVTLVLAGGLALPYAAAARTTRTPSSMQRTGPDGRRARPPAALPRPLAVHRAQPHLKILALLGFVLRGRGHAARVVRARTPCYLAVLGVVVAVSRVPLATC